MLVGGLHHIPRQHSAIEAALCDRLQRFSDIRFIGRRNIRPIIDLDPRVHRAGERLKRSQLCLQKRRIPGKRRIPLCLGHKTVFIPDACRRIGTAIQHRLDEVCTSDKKRIALPDKHADQRCIQIQPDAHPFPVKEPTQLIDTVGDHRRFCRRKPLKQRVFKHDARIRTHRFRVKQAALPLCIRLGDLLKRHALRGKALAAMRTTAAEHPLYPADKRMRANAVKKYAVKTAIGKMPLVHRLDRRQILRRGGTAKGKALPFLHRRRLNAASPHIYGRLHRHKLSRFGKHGQPKKHLDPLAVKIRTDRAIQLPVGIPPDNELFDRDLCRHVIKPRKDLLRRI